MRRLLVLAVVGCSKPGPVADTPPAAEAPPRSQAEPTKAKAIGRAPEPEPEAEPKPERAGFAPDGLTATEAWPFFAWDSAKAYAYNLNPMGPGAMLAYSEGSGWNQKIAIERPLSAELAKKAVARIGKTKGEMRVSKCPYPRHAVVLFAGDVPVGSINVCFECGDILIWPPFSRDKAWEEKKDRMYKKLMRVYDQVFPEWKGLFEEELGIPTAWKDIEAP